MEVVKGLKGSVDPEYLEILQSASDAVRTELVNDLQNMNALTTKQYNALTLALLEEGQTEKALGEMTELMGETPEQREQIMAERAMRQEQEARELGMQGDGRNQGVSEELAPALFSVMAGKKYGGKDPSVKRQLGALAYDVGGLPSKLLNIEGPQANQSGPEQFVRHMGTDPTLLYSIGLGGLGTLARPTVGFLKNLGRGLGYGATEGAIVSGLDYGRTGDPNLAANIGLGLLGGGLGGSIEAARAGVAKTPPKFTEKVETPNKQMVNETAGDILPDSPTPTSPTPSKSVVVDEEVFGSPVLGISEKQWANYLPSQKRTFLKIAQDPDKFKPFYAEIDKVSKDYQKPKTANPRTPFAYLADEYVEKAFDDFQNVVQTTGDRIKAVRDEYIPKARPFNDINEMLEEMNLGYTINRFVDPESGKVKVKFYNAQGEPVLAPTKAQKTLRSILSEEEIPSGQISVNTLRELRDSLRDSISGMQKPEKSIQKLYNSLNNLLDSRIEESINVNAPMGSNIFQQFKTDKQNFSVLMEDDIKLKKAFGEKVSFLQSDGAGGYNIAEMREKLSQRVKTGAKNPDLWRVPLTILETHTDIPVNTLMDITRTNAIANKIFTGKSLLETSESANKELINALSTFAPKGKFATIVEGGKKLKGAFTKDLAEDEILMRDIMDVGVQQGPNMLQRFAQKPIVGAGARASFVPLSSMLRAFTADYEEQQ